jgi:biopolymer transport protein ExbD
MAAKLDDGSDDLAENHDINVTPFIDVMLVLLIIFMVAAPLSTVDIPVDLPVANAKPQQRPNKPLFLTVKSDLSLAFGNDTVARGQLRSALDSVTGSDRQQRVFLRADKTVPYGELMVVMNLLRAAGYLKVALVGLEDAPPPPPQAGQAAPASTGTGAVSTP